MNAIPPADQIRESWALPLRDAGDAVRLTMDGLEEVPAGAGAEDLQASGDPAPGEPAPAGRGRANGRTAMLRVPPHLAAVEVTLSVEIGRRQLPLSQLLDVEPGQLFELDRLTDEPVSVLLNGTPFARGEVVAIGERFGIRLTEIEGQAP
ncbi:MAG: FliM/FliN family flagellar motor switch protein [Sphingomonadaceae bacterium]